DIDDYTEGKVISEDAKAKIEAWWKKTQHKRHLPISVFDDFWK
ncbi:NAD(+) synthase, partial [Lactococcus lactis]